MKPLHVLVLALGLGGGMSYAQSTQVDISARLMGKPIYLKGMWAKDKLKFSADGTPQGKYGQVSWTESGFDISKVVLSGNRLTVEGVRAATEFDRDGAMDRVHIPHGSSGVQKITIEIEGAPGGDFKPALDAIFADGVPEIMKELPPMWHPFLEKQLHEPVQLMDDEDLPRNPVKPRSQAGDPAALRIGGPVKPPRVLRQVDPEFSSSARAVRYSGSVLVSLVVETNGVPSHILIERAAGLGLDERAAEAVSRYRFAPATRDGVPVKVMLNVDVNFQIFDRN